MGNRRTNTSAVRIVMRKTVISTLVAIRADRHVHYETVAKVMALAAKAGLVRIGFVSDPTP